MQGIAEITGDPLFHIEHVAIGPTVSNDMLYVVQITFNKSSKTVEDMMI